MWYIKERATGIRTGTHEIGEIAGEGGRKRGIGERCGINVAGDALPGENQLVY